MKRRISILLAVVLSVTCFAANIPALRAASDTAQAQEQNVDAYYYGAGSTTCYASTTYPDNLAVSYGEKYGRHVVFTNCDTINVRTYTKETFAIDDLHISIEDFEGEGLSFWLANSGTGSKSKNALRFAFKNGSYLGVNYGTNARACDASVPDTEAVSGDLDIWISENQDGSVTVNLNGTVLTVPADKVAENITDTNKIYVQFSTIPMQGFSTASFTLKSIHNGDCKMGTIINNKELTPKYVPDSQVTVDENGSPDWLSQLVIAEVKIGAASPEGTFQGAVKLLDLYEEMGVNGIWLTPIYDGYDFTDPNAGYGNAGPHTVNANLTGTTDYEEGWQVVKDFVEEAHQRNIRVFFDAITWGVAYGSPLLTEHPDWFSGTAWGGAAYNWSNSALKEWYINTWVNNMLTTGADGIRCDCEPQYTGYSLFNIVKQRLAAQGRKIAVMSEHTNTRGTEGSYTYDVEQFSVNVLYGTEYNMLSNNSIFLNAANIVRACQTGNYIGSYELQKQQSGGQFKYYTFMLSCHDNQVPCAKGNRAYVGYQAILAPFIPLWLMGEEWNDNAENGVQYCKTLNWDKLYQYENREFFEDYKKYIAIRWTYPDIFGYFPENHRETNICTVKTSQGSATTIGGAYARYGGGQGILVAANKSDSNTSITLTIPYSDLHLTNATKYAVTDLLTGEVIAEGSQEELESITVDIQKDYVGVYLVDVASDGEIIADGIELLADSSYELTDTYVVKVRDKTEVTDFISQFQQRDTLRVLDAEETEVTSGSVGTGFILQSVSGGKILDQKTVVVYGDANGDGKITSTDYLLLKKYFQNTSALQGIYLYAMDVNRDGKLQSSDYLRIKAYFSGKQDLYE